MAKSLLKSNILAPVISKQPFVFILYQMLIQTFETLAK